MCVRDGKEISKSKINIFSYLGRYLVHVCNLVPVYVHTVFIRILRMIQFNVRNSILEIFMNLIIRKVGMHNYFR